MLLINVCVHAVLVSAALTLYFFLFETRIKEKALSKMNMPVLSHTERLHVNAHLLEWSAWLCAICITITIVCVIIFRRQLDVSFLVRENGIILGMLLITQLLFVCAFATRLPVHLPG
jgi:hypothetical protein